MATSNDDDERLSWREIDRLKDRSTHVSKEKGRPKSSFRSEWAKKQFLKEADKFFAGKRGSKEHKAAHSAIYKHYGSGKFQGTVRKYLSQYGLPEDWGTLLLLLDYKDTETVKEVLLSLKEMYQTKTPVEKQGLKGKLNILALTTNDDEFRELVESTLEEL